MIPPFFPPQGALDETRFRKIDEESRELLWFCLEFCGKILEARPVHPEALEMAANHYSELGYYHDGLRLDECLAGLRPNDPGVLYNLACSLALTNRREDALRTLEQAVANGYDDFRHMGADQDLDSLRGEEKFHSLLAMLTNRRQEP